MTNSLLKMKRKGQAALEFLMTYGWAILVVLIVIGAIAFFLNSNNPSSLIPKQCVLSDGFSCDDYLINKTADTLTLKITNNKGRAVNITSVIATSQELGECDVDIASGTTLFPRVLMNSDSTTFTINETDDGVDDDCDIDELPDQNVRIDLEIKWYSSQSNATFTHTTTGSLVANAE